MKDIARELLKIARELTAAAQFPRWDITVVGKGYGFEVELESLIRKGNRDFSEDLFGGGDETTRALIELEKDRRVVGAIKSFQNPITREVKKMKLRPDFDYSRLVAYHTPSFIQLKYKFFLKKVDYPRIFERDVEKAIRRAIR
jgi:hypothetical protein